MTIYQSKQQGSVDVHELEDKVIAVTMVVIKIKYSGITLEITLMRFRPAAPSDPRNVGRIGDVQQHLITSNCFSLKTLSKILLMR